MNNFENEKGDIADIMCKVRVEAACDYTIKIHNRRHPAVEKKLANRYKLIILLLQLERSDKFCLCANGPKVFWGFFLGGGAAARIRTSRLAKPDPIRRSDSNPSENFEF